MKINQKTWNCSRKQSARQTSIIDRYREFFGKSIPEGSQYWAMCGQCVDTQGTFLEGCELHQMMESGLIKPHQFHGVEIDEEIATANQKGFSQANWYCNDFYQQMQKAHADECFTPAIVNADFINMPDRACGYFADIILLLSRIPTGVMLIGNFVLEYQRFPDRNRNSDFIIEKLNKSNSFETALCVADWSLHPFCYQYHGTGKESRTKMGSVIFYKGE